jgi:hypothetical protein
MRSSANVLVGDIAATAGAFAVDHQDRARSEAAIGHDGMVARLGDAGKQPQDERRIGFLDIGLDQFDRLAKGGVVAPDENVVQAHTPKRDLAGSRSLPGKHHTHRHCHHPSAHRTLRVSPNYFGPFDSERKAARRAAGLFLLDLLSLLVVFGFCFVVLAYAGAL